MGKLRRDIWRRVGNVERADRANIFKLRPVMRAEAIAMLVERRGIDEVARRLGMSAEQVHELTNEKKDPTDMAEDDTFAFPEHVDDLEAVPEAWRTLYAPSDAQNFALIPEAAEALGAVKVAADAKLAAAHAERDAKILAQDASIEQGRRQLTQMVADGAIRQRLLERGVRLGLVPAAIATIRDYFEVAIEKRVDGGFDTLIADSFGKVPVTEAVDLWLLRDEAQAFLPPPPPTEGAFTQAVRRLRASVH